MSESHPPKKAEHPHAEGKRGGEMRGRGRCRKLMEGSEGRPRNMEMKW